jgi:hypothetical protein
MRAPIFLLPAVMLALTTAAVWPVSAAAAPPLRYLANPYPRYQGTASPYAAYNPYALGQARLRAGLLQARMAQPFFVSPYVIAQTTPYAYIANGYLHYRTFTPGANYTESGVINLFAPPVPRDTGSDDPNAGNN